MRIQKSSENTREVVPTTPKYIAANGKQALMLLQSAAAFMPVTARSKWSFTKELVRIIEVCKAREILGKVAR